jgi:thioredoxin-like negative regulator of GroEL
MQPIVNGLEQACKGKVKFTYLDGDDGRNAAAVGEFGVTSVPAIFFLSPDGKTVRTWLGYAPASQFQVVTEKCSAP